MRKEVVIYILAAVLSLAVSCSKAYETDVRWPENGKGDAAPGDASEADAAMPEESFQAIVTVRRSPTDTVYFQLDDVTRLYPVNYETPFTGPYRAICRLTTFNTVMPSYGPLTWVEWLEPVEEGAVTASAPAGPGDRLDVMKDWMTTVEDGYLTVHYVTWWGSGEVRHSLSLHRGLNPEDPYELTLVHEAAGDEALEKGDALICFDLKDLPPTHGETKILTLKWLSGEGSQEESLFRFRSRE